MKHQKEQSSSHDALIESLKAENSILEEKLDLVEREKSDIESEKQVCHCIKIVCCNFYFMSNTYID